MIVGRLLNRIISIFTGLFAIATLVLMLVWYINNSFGGFLPAATLATIERLRNYFTLGTIFCAGIEFTLKRNIIFAVGFACIVIAVAGFMLYYDFAIIG